MKYFIELFLAAFGVFWLPISDYAVQGSAPSYVGLNSAPQSECLTCCFKHQYVRDTIGGCENKTCVTALSQPRACALYIRLVSPFCDCKDGYFKDSLGYCVRRKKCVKDQCNPPKIPDNPKCKGKRMTLVGILHPKDYRVCPSRSSSSSSCRSTSSSSSSECSSSKTDSSSCSSSSSSTSTSWHKREHSSDCNSFLSFIKRNKKSSLYLLNVCNCIPPYYLNSCGECVELCQCHKKCHKIHCPGLNERYCKYTGKCVCKDGFYQNECGQCVRKDVLRNTANCLCSYPCPGPNMELRKFNAKTARTCANLNCPPVHGPFPDQYACDCISGYYMLANGTCVKACQCPETQ